MRKAKTATPRKAAKKKAVRSPRKDPVDATAGAEKKRPEPREQGSWGGLVTLHVGDSRVSGGTWKRGPLLTKGKPATPGEVAIRMAEMYYRAPWQGGTLRVLAVSTGEGDDERVICVVGNGPRSEGNARAIAAIPKMLELLKKVEASDEDGAADLRQEAKSVLDAALGSDRINFWSRVEYTPS